MRLHLWIEEESMYTVNELKSSVIRSVSYYEKGLMTQLMVGSRLFGDFAFTLHEHPQEWQEIAESLVLIPEPLIVAMVKQLAARRLPDGRWQWPPQGAIATPGGDTVFRPADASEVSVYDALAGWLRNAIDVRSRQDA
jgi:hypothetical protein